MSPRIVRAAAITLGVAAVLVVGAQGVARVLQMRDEVGRLEREIGKLRQETEALTVAANRLRTSPEAIEELARSELHMVRPGEKVYQLPPSSSEGR